MRTLTAHDAAHHRSTDCAPALSSRSPRPLRGHAALVVLVLGFATLVRAAPAPASAAFDSARALFENHHLAEAQQAFEKLAAAEPQNGGVAFYLGELAMRRDDAEQAVAYYEQAVAAAPDNGHFQRGLGDAYGRSAQKAAIFSQLGLAKKSLAAYERAVALEPANVDFHLSLFDYYRQAPGIAGGGPAKAAAEAATIKTLDVNRGRLAFARLYLSEKKYAAALAEFDDVLKASPDDYNALYQIGRLAALTGQFIDRGLASLRRCLELTPPDTDDTPSRAAVHWRIGKLLEKKSDVAGARAAYEAALKADPNFTSAAEALKKLP